MNTQDCGENEISFAYLVPKVNEGVKITVTDAGEDHLKKDKYGNYENPKYLGADISFRASKVGIIEPNEDPVTDNNFAFNYASRGVCEVKATGTSGLLGANSDLEWTLSTITSSTQTSNPDPPKGAKITFTYTTLPGSNNQFGEQTLTLKHPKFGEGNIDTQTVEIFFSRDATNHTGAGAGTTRNWYYYWKEGGVVSHLSHFEYKDKDGWGGYDPATNRLYVYNNAPKQNREYTVTNKYTGATHVIGATGEGIDCCAETCIHEMKHRWIHDNWSSLPDGDGDGIPDCQEGIPPYYFNPIDRDTYNLADIYPNYWRYGDAEFLARIAEQSPGSVDPDYDWSDTNGKQWGN